MREEWRPVVGYEEIYEVSSRGRVRSLDRTVEDPRHKRALHKKGKVLSAWKNRKGYEMVSLFCSGKKVSRPTHTLVLEAFVSLRPVGLTASHLDGDKLNNSPSNLAWESLSRNVNRKVSHGTAQRGEMSGVAKLSNQDAREIKAVLEKMGELSGIGGLLAETYGVTKYAISKIRTGSTWGWLT